MGASTTAADAERIAPSRARERVLRFSLGERLFHWAFALPFLVLLVSGILLGLPDTETLLAHREVLHLVHMWSAVALVVLPVAAVLADPRGLARDVREIDYWDRGDYRWLRLAAIPGFLRRDTLPPAGRFNAGQKLNSVLAGAGITGLIVTGALMWKAEAFPLWSGEVATYLHDLLTLLMLPLVAGHVFLAALNPSTRESLLGMITGRVDRDWHRRHHGRESAAS
jgi:formate dehydrogenase subunit gamma